MPLPSRVTPQVWEASILTHICLHAIQPPLGNGPAFSYYLKLLEAAVCELQEGIAGERPVISLRKSWMLRLQYHVTQQLPGIMRIMPGSQHPKGSMEIILE